MKINFKKISSVHNLAGLSVSLWFLSLALNGLTLGYNGRSELIGLYILAMGWLSPLVLNFAWFANLFFISAFFKLTSGKKATLSAIVAAILCIDMFRMNEYLVNEAGHTSVVYGYGWGAILWLISIFLMLVAAGVRLNNTETSEQGVKMQISGLVLLLITILSASYFSIHDRFIANKSEISNLANVAFKRTKVCSTEVPIDILPIKHFSGKLEVQLQGNQFGVIYPFSEGKSLVEWGIPYVTVSGHKFTGPFLDEYGSVENLFSDGRSGAVLKVTESNSKFINATLIEEKTGRVVFNFKWIREPYPINHDHYCPEYSPFPQEHKQPRMILMQGLGLS